MKENNFNINSINFNDEDMTVNSFLDAISEIEYPKYILEAIDAIQEWLRGLAVNIEEESALDDEPELKPEAEAENLDLDFDFDIDEDENENENDDDESGENDFEHDEEFMEFLKHVFGNDESESSEMEESLEALFERIDAIDENVDVIPNTHKPAGNKDAMIINILSPESDGGLRTAIDYAGVFNRKKCERVWILSDSFVFDDAAHFTGHITALEKQGITVRFILVNPWGWVELPLSRASAQRKQMVWRGDNNSRHGRNDLDFTGD
ncbi:MAG: hypothetical protein IJR21_05180 [Synergistaceae bacterium]|nr:hypothetical protein [Synergistaceae bacterium]